MTKEQRRIKELTEENTRLQAELREEKVRSDSWYKQYSAVSSEVNELYATFDLLGVPRKNEKFQYSGDLSLSNRMTLYVAGIKTKPKDDDIIF